MNFLMVDCGSDWAFVFVFTDSILSINAAVLVDIDAIDEKNEKDKNGSREYVFLEKLECYSKYEG